MHRRQTPLSRGEVVVLTDHLAFEQPTLFVFYKPSSTLEQGFFEEIKKLCTNNGVGVQAIHLTSGDEPIARKNEITQTPTGLIYDRRGRLTGRATTVPEIVQTAIKAADVGRIDWAMPGTPEAEQVKALVGFDDPRKLPGIMRAMSLKPEAMAGMIRVARQMHFAEGALKVRTKELIATYVSSLNQCKFCLSSHAGFLAKQGQELPDVEAVGLGDPSKAPGLSPKERALLSYIKRLTEEPWKLRDSDVERLRKAGWTDPEIYEATFDGSLFAFFNRMANAYGLDYATDGWIPPAKKGISP